MATQSPRNSNDVLQPVQQNLRVDHTHLFFQNHGLFSENYLTNRLPSEKSDSFVLEHWETEPLPEFSACYEWMMSTWDEYKDIFPTLDESQLEDKWIRPILQRLGWTYEVQDRLKKRGKTQIPDYSLFPGTDSYKNAKGAKTNEAYFAHVLAIADAKAMGVNLDGTGRTNSNPSYQIVRYLEDTGCAWGILTDGEFWRLYSLNSESKYTAYFEVNIRKMLAKRDDERFKYFFNFFRKEAFTKKTASNQSFLDVVFYSGQRYAKEVETALKHRAFKIARSICVGFSKDQTNLSEQELKEIYDHSLYYIFRLMFILNCEAKGLFDVNDISSYYPVSLRHLAVKLKEDSELNRSWPNQSRSYDYIQSLMDLLESGDRSVGVHALGSEVFHSGDPKFYKNHKISDQILNPAIVELACALDETDELRFIDYKRLSPDHLGSLFEGLLEFHPVYADRKCVVEGGKVTDWQDLDDKKKFKLKDSVVNKGELYLESGKGDRKETGSFYTPSYVVDHILESTLGPMVEGKPASEILKLKVCDPAMGSGHFLIGTVKYLEEKILDVLYARDEKAEDIDREEIRWRILKECIFGVDINPLAVELAKFSLWMYSARRDHDLETLGDQLLLGNSLVSTDIKLEKKMWGVVKPFDWASEFKTKLDTKNFGFDAVVGNPPYVQLAMEKYYNPTVSKYLTDVCESSMGRQNTFGYFIDRSLKAILKKNGRMGFIIPNTILTQGYYEELRETILANTLDQITTFEHPVFDDAVVETTVLTITRDAAKKDHKVRVLKMENRKMTLSEKSVLQSVFEEEAGRVFQINLDGSAVKLRKKMDSTGTHFKDHLNINQAIALKNDRAKSLTSKKEDKNCKKVLDGRNINKFSISWGGEYLRYDVKNIHSCKRTDIFEAAEKVFFRRVGNGIIATLDTEQYYALNTLIVVTPKEESTCNVRFVLGLLNSRVVDYYYKTFLKSSKKVFSEIQAKQIGDMPFPDLSTASAKKTAQEVVTCVNSLLREYAKASPQSAVIARLSDELDSLVGNLYGLSSSDVRDIIDASTSTPVTEVEDENKEEKPKSRKKAS